MPLQRRLPKVGFTSKLKKFVAEINLNDISRLSQDNVDLKCLIDNNVVPIFTKKVKIINTGSVVRPVILKGIAASLGAKKAIVAAGGQVEA